MDNTLYASVLTKQDRESIKKLFKLFHTRAREKGFHGQTDMLHDFVNDQSGSDFALGQLTVHRGNRLALIMDEVVEAREEIRKGKQPDEIYTSVTDETKAAKPEGYLAEMADVLVRFGDTIAEEDHYSDLDFIDLFLDVLESKISFNAKRSHMNGGKKF